MAQKKAAAKKKPAKKKIAATTSAAAPPAELQWSMLGTCEPIQPGDQKSLDVQFVKPTDVGSQALNFTILGTCLGVVGTRRTMKVNFQRRMVQGKPRFTLTLEE